MCSVQPSYSESLSWNESEQAKGYIVHYWSKYDIGTYIVEDQTKLSLDVLPLKENETYYFAVKAFNTAGISEFSNSIKYPVLACDLDNDDDCDGNDLSLFVENYGY